VGIMGELNAVDGKYAKLRELYPDSTDNHRFPWTPPLPGYCLPKTVTEFEREYEKATGNFHTVLAEGEAMGALTTAPREKEQVTLVVCPTEEEAL
jgi:hypothetical protein